MLIPDAPPHWNINPDESERKQLLKESGAYLLRYVTNWDTENPKAFWYVIKDHFSSIDEFSGNTRNKIRRGLKNNFVRKAELHEMMVDGFEVYQRAFDRYHKAVKPMKESRFREQLVQKTNRGYEFWSVVNRSSGKMVAFAEVQVVDYSGHMKVIKFHPDYLKSYSSYALFYELLEYYLGKKGLRYLSNGTRNISHDTNIQYFLLDKFNFRKAYCRLNISYKPAFGALVYFLYPFRNFIRRIPGKLPRNLYTLLLQEKFKRFSEPDDGR
jgi:hypothetical protein